MNMPNLRSSHCSTSLALGLGCESGCGRSSGCAVSFARDCASEEAGCVARSNSRAMKRVVMRAAEPQNQPVMVSPMITLPITLIPYMVCCIKSKFHFLFADLRKLLVHVEEFRLA